MLSEAGHRALAHILAVLTLSALSILGTGCLEKNASQEELQEDRVVKLIDERRYDDAISLLEPVANDPDKQSLRIYLAQAHLGSAGFEPLRFASRVVGPQGTALSDHETRLERLVPSCPAETMSDPAAHGARCVLKRLFRHLPDSENANFSRARELLRAMTTDPEKTPAHQNLLSSLVETSSAVSRLGRILLAYQALDAEQAPEEEIARLFVDLGKIVEEARNGLSRARYSGAMISKYLTGFEKTPVFHATGVNLEFVETTGIPLLMRLTEGTRKDNLEGALSRVLVLQALEEASVALAAK